MAVANLQRPPQALGAAGLLPQIACVILGLSHPDLRLPALVAGGLYAAAILSFLGGMWWMQALCRSEPRWWPYVLAVAPSLIAWGAIVPWLLGVASSQISLIILGGALLISPLGDRAVGSFAGDVPPWRRLRHLLSGGLGAMTIILSTLA